MDVWLTTTFSLSPAQVPYALLLMGALGGLLVGLLAWVIGRAFRERAHAHEIATLEAEHDELQTRFEEAIRDLAGAQARLEPLQNIESELKRARDTISILKVDIATGETRMAERERVLSDEMARLTKVRGELEKDFERLAMNVMQASQARFLQLANETFSKHKVGAEADYAKRSDAIQQMLRPVEETLTRYQSELEKVEKARIEAYSSLNSEIRNVALAQSEVRQETSKLVNALRSAPKTRGRWGEQQLQNVLELAGMSEYVDFRRQVNVEGADGNLYPDAVIRMPGGREIVVDAKAPMAAFLDATEAVDESDREALFAQHAQQVRTHVQQLASKRYWETMSAAPDFVVMFLPGENLYSAAIERYPDLFEEAVRKKVLIATPTTMIALAKAIAYGWRQERMSRNVKIVAELGQELYRRMAVMGGHVLGLGKSIERSVKSYNTLVGSLEGSVLPQARKFRELEIEGTGEELPDLLPVDIEPREVQPGRDFDLTEHEPEALTTDQTEASTGTAG
ncbi:MAG: DNA recombination protein RmuC [Pseudomonadota bacterium]